MANMLLKRIKDWATSITSFRTGDVIPVDGPSGTAKMSKDDLLQETAKNLAPVFSASKAYSAGEAVMYQGTLYEFTADHAAGAWNAAHANAITAKDSSLSVPQSFIYSDATTNISDLNNVNTNFVTYMQTPLSTKVANLPTDLEGSPYIFIAFRQKANRMWFVNQVILSIGHGTAWRRQYTISTNTWSSWVKSDSRNLFVEPNQIFDNFSNLASLDDADVNSVYVVQRTKSTTTTNFPSDYTSGVALLVTLKGNYSKYSYQVSQFLFKASTKELWFRQFNSNGMNWGAWKKETSVESVVTIGSGKIYSTLRAGIAAAYAAGNTKVIIYPGTYDCVEEWRTELEGIASSGVSAFGNPLGNGIHVVAMPGAKITANVDRADFPDLSDAQFTNIKTYFEPFGVRGGNFTLEDVVIEAKNTRYCVHDELAGSTTPCIHKYINCRMTKTADTATSSNDYPACIGGGLGKNVTVVVDGGYYKTTPIVGFSSIESGNIDYAQMPITYHNGNVEGAYSRIEIKNVYLADKGYLRFGGYGPTETKSEVLISGCRMAYPPLVRRENSSAENVNFEAYTFANEIVNDGSWSSTITGDLSSTWIQAT